MNNADKFVAGAVALLAAVIAMLPIGAMIDTYAKYKYGYISFQTNTDHISECYGDACVKLASLVESR